MAFTTVQEVIDKLPELFNANAAKGQDVVFQLNISGDGGGSWNVSVKNDTFDIKEGTHEKPSVTMNMSSETYLKMSNKKLIPMQAAMTGKLKTVGNIMTAQKFSAIFPL